MAKRRGKIDTYLDPDEIFLDSSNIPSFDTHQFEGWIEKPIAKRSIYLAGLFFVLVGTLFVFRIGYLQVVSGQEFAERSQNNSLRNTIIYPERGIIYDRNKVELTWNNPSRTYINQPGFSHLLGYTGYPTQKEVTVDKRSEQEMIGKAGVELSFENILGGKNGLKLEEVDVLGEVQSNHVLQEAENGRPVTLSIDSRIQAKFFEIIKKVVIDRGFSAGSGLIMDVRTGEIISMVSYPEYDSNVLTSHKDSKMISSYFTDKNLPFLDRAISGLYTPGSVFKPFVAIGALNEKIIDPNKKILSTGQISIPNPYDPKVKTVFKDWKAHGWVDMRKALAVSSDVYFYAVGGGYEDQKGLGIYNIGKYARLFGLSQKTGVELNGEETGVIPDPAWKEKTFNGDPWRLGNTYHTSIGQYGVQVTPIQLLRGLAAVANNGRMLTPTVIKNTGQAVTYRQLDIPADYFKVIQEGMRQGVTSGTSQGLNVDYVHVATKTGTAEIGVSKAHVNSLVEGFFPYENPRYAFLVALEKSKRENTIGGTYVMMQLFDWMNQNTKEYFK